MTTILGNTLVTAIQATGKIKRYQIVVSLWGVLSFPLTWLAFKLGASPLWAYIVYFVVYFVLLFIRMPLVKHIIRPAMYLKDVIMTVLVVTVIAALLPTLLCLAQPESFLRLVEVCILSVVCTGATIYTIGMKANERKRVQSFILKKVHKQ